MAAQDIPLQIESVHSAVEVQRRVMENADTNFVFELGYPDADDTIVTPTHSVFYAVITKNLRPTSNVHMCQRPSSLQSRLAFHALTHFLWCFFLKIRCTFDIAFEQAQSGPEERAKTIWKGEWITQDISTMSTLWKSSRVEFRFIHELYTYLDDIPLGTHWIDALLNRDGLSLEMKFSKLSWRADGMPGPPSEPDIHVIVSKAMFHQCAYILETFGPGLFPSGIDGCLGWFRLELRHSPIPAFPLKAYQDAYKTPDTEEKRKDQGHTTSSLVFPASAPPAESH